MVLYILAIEAEQPPSFPRGARMVTLDDGRLALALRWQAWTDGVSGCVGRRLDVLNGECEFASGIDAERAEALRAFLALASETRLSPGAGRPDWSGTWASPEEFTTVVFGIIRERHTDKLSTKMKEVVKVLNDDDHKMLVSMRTFQRWRREAGYTHWHHLVVDALKTPPNS
jgi:hypothetical protein